MPQIKSQFTSEQKLDFEEKYNLWVYSHEAMIEVLMQQNEALELAHYRIDELQEAQKELEKLHNSVVDEVYNPKIKTLEECKALETRIQQLEERLMEVASGVPIWLCDTESPNIRKNSLADKWK